MKFDHQLKFNAAPEWKDFYINYARLKVCGGEGRKGRVRTSLFARHLSRPQPLNPFFIFSP